MLERVWRKGNSPTLLLRIEIGITSMKTVWKFLRKLNIELPYDPAIPLLGIYPDKIVIQKDTCTPMFIAALFTIAKTWKQPKRPSTDDWIKVFFLISFLICSLTHWFFSSMLFSLHVVSFLSFLFLWLISSFTPLWSEKILEIISILKFVKVSFVAQYMIDP